MTGDLVKAMRAPARSPSSPPSTAVHGRRRDDRLRLRHAPTTARSKLAFLFVRVSGRRRHGRRTLLPRLIGLSRAADLLHRPRRGRRGGRAHGLPQPLVEPEQLLAPKRRRWRRARRGPTFGHTR